MAETSPGGISDYAVLSQTRGEEDQSTPGEKGFATLGQALSGGAAAEGQQAWNNGARIGAQTIDALAQAKQRITAANQAHIAAGVMRNPAIQQQAGWSPEFAEYMAANTEAGVDPNKVMQAGQAFQSITNRNTLADSTQPREKRLGAAFALDPGSAVPKGEGLAGNYVDPLGSTTANPNPVHVSDQQSAMNQSEIDLRSAQAAAAPINAAAHATSAAKPSGAAADSPSGKLPVNYRWQANDQAPAGTAPSDEEYFAHDASGRRIAEPIPGAPQEPATSDRFHGVMTQASRETRNEVQNMAQVGFGTSLGAMNIASKTGSGFLEAIKQNLGSKLSDTDQQLYNTSSTQIGRFAGVQENGGRFVPEPVADSITKILSNLPANSLLGMLGHAAAIEQLHEAANDTIQASGARQSYKDNYKQDTLDIAKSIPFTMEDVIDASHGKINPAIASYLRSKAGGGAPSPVAAPSAGWGTAKVVQ